MAIPIGISFAYLSRSVPVKVDALRRVAVRVQRVVVSKDAWDIDNRPCSHTCRRYFDTPQARQCDHLLDQKLGGSFWASRLRERSKGVTSMHGFDPAGGGR